MVTERKVNIFSNNIKITQSESLPNPRPDSDIGGKFIYIPEKNGYIFVPNKKIQTSR